MRGCCLILRRAFRLNRLCDKSSIGGNFALDQALRSVLKRIGQWVRSHIADRKTLPLLDQNKINTAGQVLDRPGLDIASYAKTLMHGITRQCRKLRDSVIIRFALLSSDPGQARKRNDNNSCPNGKLRFAFHGSLLIQNSTKPALGQYLP